MKEFDVLLRRIDQHCARLNAGLAAVAIVLAVLVSAELTIYASRVLMSAQQSNDWAVASD